ncbi:MAG: geranylgeranylglycerol-phosphate geranylgeranyltransferase [Candidatus Bathyarchaeia archaeon]
MQKLGGYLRLIRPINCAMMGFAVVVGATMAAPSLLSSRWQVLPFGFLTGFMLTAASMVINDYYDREIDAINEPNRPIPSGLIKPKEALTLASILTVFGFASASVNAYLADVYCLAIAIIAWAIFVAYTTVGKRSGLPGNFLVSTCVSIPFVYGSCAIAGLVKPNVLVFAAMVFLSNTGREITKGIVDIQGDKQGNVKTLAVRFGEKKAAVAAASFYLSAVLISPIPWFQRTVSFWFIPLVAVTDFGLAASSFMLLRDFSRENARKIKNTVLLWFVVGLLAFAVGALTVS